MIPSVWRDRAGLADGPKLLRNLKENGNYLTPGGGINLMSLIAVVLRGAILNLLFWIPPIAVLLGVLHATARLRCGALGSRSACCCCSCSPRWATRSPPGTRLWRNGSATKRAAGPNAGRACSSRSR